MDWFDNRFREIFQGTKLLTVLGELNEQNSQPGIKYLGSYFTLLSMVLCLE